MDGAWGEPMREESENGAAAEDEPDTVRGLPWWGAAVGASTAGLHLCAVDPADWDEWSEHPMFFAALIVAACGLLGLVLGLVARAATPVAASGPPAGAARWVRPSVPLLVLLLPLFAIASTATFNSGVHAVLYWCAWVLPTMGVAAVVVPAAGAHRRREAAAAAFLGLSGLYLLLWPWQFAVVVDVDEELSTWTLLLTLAALWPIGAALLFEARRCLRRNASRQV